MVLVKAGKGEKRYTVFYQRWREAKILDSDISERGDRPVCPRLSGVVSLGEQHAVIKQRGKSFQD